MATTTTKPNIEIPAEIPGIGVNTWPGKPGGAIGQEFSPDAPAANASHSDALQALLAFSALHEQVRRRKALASRRNGFDAGALPREFESNEHFVLDEVLHLVAERAIAITGADGLAIALAENNEIVLRASAGTIKPDVGARLDRESAFSGACFRSAQIVRCDDTETDDRVNLHACRRLGARSMIAVPLCGRRRVIGLLEAFSAEPFGFNDSDVHSLSLLAELILGALKPEDEDRFAESASLAATALESAPVVKTVSVAPPIVAPPVKPVAAAVVTPQVELSPSVAAPAPVVTPQVEPSRSVAIPAPVLPLAKPVQTAAPVLAPSPVVPAIPREAVTAPAPVAAEETIVETATALDTDIALDAPAAGHKHGILIALVLVMMAAVATAGVWWKIKNAQVGSVMVQSPKPVLKPVVPAEPVTTPAAASGAAADAGLDALSTPSSASTTPATPQELSKFPVVSGVREWSSADSTTVVLDLQDQVQYEAHRLSNPDRIFFDLRDTALAPELAGKTIEVSDALLHRIRVAQPVPGTTRVVLEIKGNSTFSVSLEPNPYRLVVQVHKVGTAPKGAVNLFPGGDAEKNRMAIVIPPPGKEDLQLRARVPKMRIVVDAGHGGWDLGTVGRRGLLEKDLVLEIGQRLGKLLESRLGADVIYTRQDDTYIPLDERASIANQSQADLFVSVHGNNSDLPSARGIETYYSNSVSTPSAKDLETRAGNSKNMVSAALSSAGLHERIEQSRRLAASVQRSLYGTLAAQNPGLRDRGVKEAGFVVLTESAMPGILAEVSFVSSPTDEQKLRSDGYREQIAEALYKGIARYAASGTRGVKVASSGK